VGPTIFPTTKIFDLENSLIRYKENYVFLIFSDNHHLDMTDIMTPTPKVTGNFAYMISDMCSTL